MKDKTRKKASIIIPTKDKMSHLSIVLKSFASQVTDEVEIVIIFDGCSSESLREFEKLRLPYRPETVICKTNIGRAAARNRGIEKAKGEIIIFSDDDVIPCRDFIQRHINAHRSSCVLLGEVRYLDYTKEEIDRLHQMDFSRIDYERLERDTVKKGLTALRRLYRPVWDRIFKPVSFLTTNASVEKTDLVKSGMFDENFRGWGYEDIDLGYRLGMNGIRFRRDTKAVNYHVNHPLNKKEKSMEAEITLNYFLDKIRKDRFSRLVLVAYFKMGKIFGKFE